MKESCPLLLCFVLFASLSIGCDETEEPYSGPVALSLIQDLSSPLNAGTVETVNVLAATPEGSPLAGIEITFTVSLGGGTLSEAMVTTGADGSASTEWTIGAAPVRNLLVASVGEDTLDIEGTPNVDEPWEPAAFGDVGTFLDSAGIDGSTEDLVFDAQGRLMMGADTGLITLDADGNATLVETSGDPIGRVLGMTLGPDGNVWFADSVGHALSSVDSDGVVTIHLGGSDGKVLNTPNDVAAGPDGRLYVSDTCLGEVIRFNPVTSTIEDRLVFDVENEGGPNGVEFDADGALWVTTENAVFFCDEIVGDAFAEVANLSRVPLIDTGFGEREVLFENVGIFGDGLTFDSEGNMYVIFDFQGSDAFESHLYVLPEGGTELVPFIMTSDRILANVIFGQGDYGEDVLYFALLAVSPLSRALGAESFQLGITGL